MKIIDDIKNKIAITLLIVISAVVLNNSLFVHVHRLDTGEIIVHAHPFNPFSKAADSTAKHNHNYIDFQLIKILNGDNFWVIGTVLTIILFLRKAHHFFANKTEQIIIGFDSMSRIRPPPQFIH